MGYRHYRHVVSERYELGVSMDRQMQDAVIKQVSKSWPEDGTLWNTAGDR